VRPIVTEELPSPIVFSEAETDRGGIIHVANIKGGVGKSTLATNLAASLSKRGPVLLIDLDVQGSAGAALGIDGAETLYTSCDFFKRRFSSEISVSQYAEMLDVTGMLSKLEEMAIGTVVGSGSIDDAIVKVSPRLHLVPAGAGLFDTSSGYRYGNFLHNLNIARRRYKYIVIDTPSVWDRLTRFLYVNCDLNLIPVTLNALSTKSFKKYLISVKSLIARNPHVRLRVVKNDVTSNQCEKSEDKARTIHLNRAFLESLLCGQQLSAPGGAGEASRPPIMFDLEIPELPAIRDAQDAGKTLQDYGGDPAAAKAFHLLAKNVQQALNGINRENISASVLEGRITLISKLCAALFVIAIVAMNKPVHNMPPPRPMAPQQVMESATVSAIVRTFTKGDNIYRLAKHAISAFRAVVPSQRQVNDYIRETIDAHNMTRLPNEPRIIDRNRIPVGTQLSFYPPMSIVNRQERTMVPAYRFFMDMVDDEFPYVTGDWCERGTAHRQAHYAMDVAAMYGSNVISPVDGIAAQKNDPLGGRTVAVMFGDAMISFSHLDQRFVRDGDSVKAGMHIGTVGLTGRTSGPHVHISYGIKSMSRHDITFGRNSYRLTDPKYLFYEMAFAERVDE
jgi:cellulose biosynthesis protein BcsQ